MLSLRGLVQVAWFESCSESCRGNCGFREPQAKGGELTTFCITKGTGTQPDEWTISRGRTFTLRLWGYEMHGVPLFEVLPWGNQLELLFCYCTRVKSRIETTETLLWETWVWGGQREDLVCLCVWGGGGGWRVRWEEALVPAQGVQVWLPEQLLDGQTGRFPQHLLAIRSVRAIPCTRAVLFVLSQKSILLLLLNVFCIIQNLWHLKKKSVFCYWKKFEKYLNY